MARAAVQKRILVVEDESAIRQTLRYNLTREGYQVSEASTGTAALTAARREHPDLILLDLMLPELNGLEVCRVLRQEMTTPILILTAKGTELDKVVGLQIGADDYVTKPFSLNELMARVSALLRRSEMSTREQVDSREVEEFGGFRIDRAARTVHIDGAELRLAPKEFDLLSLMVLNAGRVLSRQTIIQKVWGASSTATPKPSTCTCAGCARSSRTSTVFPSVSPRSSGLGTGSIVWTRNRQPTRPKLRHRGDHRPRCGVARLVQCSRRPAVAQAGVAAHDAGSHVLDRVRVSAGPRPAAALPLHRHIRAGDAALR